MSATALAPREEAEQGIRNVRVLVFHDQEVVRWGLRLLLSRQPWTQRCVCATSERELETFAARYEPHVAILGTDSAGRIAPMAKLLRDVAPWTHLLLSVDREDSGHETAAVVGAAGCVSTRWPADRLMETIHTVAAGERLVAETEICTELNELSRREVQVLRALATGSTNKQIGELLFLSPQTVKHHASRAYRKLGARNRVEAVHRARLAGLLD